MKLRLPSSIRLWIPSLMMVLSLCPALAGSRMICDEGTAREYCDQSPLLKIEGIWEFPSDGTRVLIRRDDPASRRCSLILLSSPDCRLTPGEAIGTLSPAADPGKYSMSLCRRRSNGILSDPGSCAASLSSSGNSISVKTRKFRISLRGALWFLPKFWRALRISVSDPQGELSDGLVRIYPRPAGRDTEPVYL